jgi:hypothetical protein
VSEPPEGAPPQQRLRVARLLLPCHPGAAAALGAFYAEVLGARVAGGGGGGGGGGGCEVVLGAGTSLAFKARGGRGGRRG